MEVFNESLRRNRERKLKNEGYIDQFMSNFFVFAGIWKSASDHQHNPRMGVLNLIVLTIGFLSICYKFMLKYNDIDINTEILLHVVEIFHSICAQVMLLIKKPEIARLTEAFNVTFDQMNLPIKNREESMAILKKERDYFLKVMRLTFAAIVFIYTSILIDSHVLYTNSKQKLLYPSWFPFETDSNHIWFYYLAVLFQGVIYLEMLCIDLATAGLWYGTINMVGGMLDILGLSCQTLSDESASVFQNPRTREDFDKKFKSCIDLHNFLKGLVHDLNLSLGMIFLEVVYTSQIAICFCGFHVIQAIYTRETTRLIKYSIGVGVFSLVLFVYCASGQKLKNKSEDLFHTLYCSQWYQQSRSFKHSLYMCQTSSKKSLVIHGAHFVQANLHTYMSSLRAVFSYLNFLLAMKDKN